MIVAVAGGKGGVGTSTIAFNLAGELDAVVVDADLSTGDLPRGTGPDLHDLLVGRGDVAEAVERVGPVRVLPCGRTLAGARAADLSRFSRVVAALEREYGRVVVDCPAGLARDVGIALDSAHLAALVTTPDEAALVDVLRTRRLARTLETPVVAGILNRVTTPGERVDGIASRLDQHLAASTVTGPETPVVAEARRRWRPVRDVDPDCPAVAAVESVARSIERCEQRGSDRIRGSNGTR